MTRAGNPWIVTFWNLDRTRRGRITIWATDSHDAWNQAGWRLGTLDDVVSVKPLSDILEEAEL